MLTKTFCCHTPRTYMPSNKNTEIILYSAVGSYTLQHVSDEGAQRLVSSPHHPCSYIVTIPLLAYRCHHESHTLVVDSDDNDPLEQNSTTLKMIEERLHKTQQPVPDTRKPTKFSKRSFRCDHYKILTRAKIRTNHERRASGSQRR